MATRDRDVGRHYLSGSTKRKVREEKLRKEQVVMTKIPKLTTFFQNKQANSVPEVVNVSQEAPEPSISTPGPETEAQNNELASEIDKPLGSECIEVNANEKVTGISDMHHEIQDYNSFSTDLGKWHSKLNENVKEYWIAEGCYKCQHINSDFTLSKRYYENERKTRFCQKSYFIRVHKLTNTKHERNWLCYSPSKTSLFCFPCKVMGLEDSSSTFIKEGFNDWKNGNTVLTRHEESTSHRKTMVALLARKKKGQRIDTAIVKEMESKKQYWRKLLQRIVEVIKFLAERGLPFRGRNECISSSQNGNYLGLLELFAKFDPFLSEHLSTYGSKGKGVPSYLSKDICEEFINLIGTRMLGKIITEIKECKYYSISLDSTPDSAFVDQLTLIMRYVLPSGPIERFIKFLDMEGHTSAQIANTLLNFLKEIGIDIKDCRGQSYDNASNMSGKYNGLQSLIKEKCQFAEYVPCCAHSLNLVGSCAAESCPEAVRFFMFVENLYTFFSASTNRWKLLTNKMSNCNPRLPRLKRLSDTRWSARAEATSALNKGYTVITNVLNVIVNDPNYKAESRQQAKGMLKTIKKLETGIMIALWDQILQRFQSTSASLQSSDQDLNTSCALYESLHRYVATLRSSFIDFENRGKTITGCHQYNEEISRKKQRNKMCDQSHGFIFDDRATDSMQPSEKFRIQTYLVIIDNLLAALSKRQMAYSKLKDMFGFLRHLPKADAEEVRYNTSKLIKIYPEDLENELKEEMVQFSELLKTDLAEIASENKNDMYELKLYRVLRNNSLESCFPNVEIVLRIYLTLMVTNCSGERSFSKLKRIKNEVRSNMTQERLNSLSLMSIEHELLKDIDIASIIISSINKRLRSRS